MLVSASAPALKPSKQQLSGEWGLWRPGKRPQARPCSTRQPRREAPRAVVETSTPPCGARNAPHNGRGGRPRRTRTHTRPARTLSCIRREVVQRLRLVPAAKLAQNRRKRREEILHLRVVHHKRVAIESAQHPTRALQHNNGNQSRRQDLNDDVFKSHCQTVSKICATATQSSPISTFLSTAAWSRTGHGRARPEHRQPNGPPSAREAWNRD